MKVVALQIITTVILVRAILAQVFTLKQEQELNVLSLFQLIQRVLKLAAHMDSVIYNFLKVFGANFLISPILFFIILLFSCGSKKDSESSGQITSELVLPVNSVESYFPWEELIESVEIIHLETSPSSILGYIDKVVVRKNRIYILDRSQETVLIFSKEGKFLRKLQHGLGPGEIYECRDFTIDEEDNLVVLGSRLVSSFNGEGQYLSQIKFDMEQGGIPINPLAIASTNNGYFLWTGSFGKGKFSQDLLGSKMMFHVNKPLDKITGSYFEMSRLTMEGDRFQSTGNNFFVQPNIESNVIYKISAKNPQHLGEISIDFDQGYKEYDSDLSEGLVFQDIVENGRSGAIQNIVSSDEFLFFDYFHETKRYHFIYFFSTKKSYYGLVENPNWPVNFIHVRNSSLEKNELVTSYYPAMISNFHNNFKPSIELPAYQKELLKNTYNVKMDDNPLICILNLKEP